MALHTSTDVDELKTLLSAAPAADPVANTVFSSILVGLDREDAAIAHLDPPAAGVAAAPDVVDALLAAVGRVPTERMDERLFRLDELRSPTDVAGAAVLATADDLDLLCRWYADFGLEAFGRLPPGVDIRTQVERGLAVSRCWLWTVGGAPVSMAVRHPPFDGVARIGPVYTPREQRAHGYGSAATAVAARDILDAGAVPCLYTDLSNPTSNRIYPAIGFYPVLDRCAVRFD